MVETKTQPRAKQCGGENRPDLGSVETESQPPAKRCGGVSDGSDVEITLRWSVSVLMDRRQVWTVPTAAPLPLAAGSRLGRRIHLKLSSENGVKG